MSTLLQTNKVFDALPVEESIEQRRLAIAQVMGSFGGGGAQRAAHNLAEGLAQMGHRSICLALRSAGGFAGNSKGVEVMELGLNSRGPLALVNALITLRRFVKEQDVDVLHVHGSRSLPLCALAMAGMGQRPVLCFTWHDSGEVLAGGGVRARVMRWALRRCRWVYGSSGSVVERLIEASGVVAKVMPNGVPVIKPARPTDATAPTLLWMGRIVPDKDPQALLLAAAKLRDKGHKFRVILAGSALERQQAFFDETTRMRDELGLADIVAMPGWVEDTTGLVRSCDIGVQTSHTEGLSMALLEMMMAGLAVVATDVGDTSLPVQDGVTGLLVKPKDVEGLAEALERVVGNEELRKRIGEAGRQRAMEQFSVQHMAEEAMKDYAVCAAMV